MEESGKRRHKRYDVDEVRGSLMEPHDAKILNLSLTGMAIETSAMLRVGTSYRLRIPGADGSTLQVPAEVCWCRLVRTDRNERGDVVSIYHAGIDFRSILDDRAREMLQFIEEHVIVELDRRLTGRFRAKEGTPVALDAQHRFVVRRISLSGLLVEAEICPEVETRWELEVARDGKVFSAHGRVAYVEPRGEEGCNLGIELLDISDEARQAIEGIIESRLE